MITAVLDRTAVVHPIGKQNEKVLVNLNKILVSDERVIWMNKSVDEMRLYRSRRNNGSYLIIGGSDDLT